ncbi:ABC transporter substrate-binding protein [Sphingomonas naphthae]|uniref:ABC transporter substrate-binding protein n=1 Tax=Sphingomonas naphthae TaxID=1813468 RepID=A0ABY7TG26_9SPHN|nr:ABC transporter substrate-binding protein [Sphingomonas naphthae]WCT71880.1 ABC transporter substrate-binding protein [Sphingomonas naphthae]
MNHLFRYICTSLLIGAATAASAADRPAGYPRSYDALIADAQAEGALSIYANADQAELAPIVAAFRTAYPGIRVQYSDIGSTEMFRRFVAETKAGKPSADLVWSSAMDLQVKLINDGYAQAYASPEKPGLPPLAVWKNMGYGVTAEPIAFAYNRRLLPPAQVPHSHQALEEYLRAQGKALAGRVVTFDPARSNVGYLYLSQDYAITRDTASLVEAIAATRPKLALTTEPMLRAIAEGQATIAYNVIGSYALKRAAADPRLGVVFPRDYTLVTSRIAFIARDARHAASAKLFLDFLLSRRGQAMLARQSLWPVRTDVPAKRLPPAVARPIRVGPQLLVNLDRITRQRFLARWNQALAQGASHP